MWIASMVVHIVVFIFQVLFNIFIFIINMVSRLLGKGAVLAYKKYSNNQAEKMEASAKEKISVAQEKVYGLSNNYLDEPSTSEKNVVVLEKMIKPLSDDTVAVSMLQDDELAMEMAQNTEIKYVIFELQNKRRLSFAIPDSNDFDMVYVGDVGTLTYQGRLWLSFERNSYELKD